MMPDGLTICASSYGPKETMDRLVVAVTGRSMAVLARIDHGAAAAKVDMALRPTEVLIFGNPRAGTPLMQAGQTVGIDLPLKALVWQDEEGKTFLGYNRPQWIAQRHGLGGEVDKYLAAMSAALAKIATEAVGAEVSARDPAEPDSQHLDELLDEALEESFPASDPPSITRD